MYPYTSNPGAALEPVSPPSSPEPFAGNEYMDYDVSPIDDEPDIFQRQLESNQPPRQTSPSHAPRGVQTELTEDQDHQQQHPQVISGPRSGIGKTSIPTMRRERRRQRDAANKEANKDTRLSPRIPDEPLPKPSQPMGWSDPINPRPEPQAGPPDRIPKFGSTTTVTSESQRSRQASNPNTSSFGQRMRHQFGRGKPESIESRPPWNGASGRQAQILPVREDLDAAPLKIPPKSSKRERAKAPVNLPPSDLNEGASAAASAAVRRLMPIRTAQTPERQRAQSPAVETPKSGVPITPQAYVLPVQPAASPQQWPTRESSMSTPSNATAPSHLHIPNQFSIPRRAVASPHQKTSSHAPQLSTSSSIYSDNPANQDEDDDATWKRLASGDPFGRQAPPPPPPPPPPRDEWSPETVPSNSDEEEVEIPIKNLPVVSVMERKRPIPGRNSPAGMMDNAIVISLKTATIAEQEAEKQAEAEKELPPVPAEPLEPEDRIAYLTSQMETLAIRRVNLAKAIKQLTELMPKERLIASVELQRRREEEKKKVDNMSQELADIQQQEYVLGLKLHRAYRRQDRELEHNTGTLWVRRVTG